MKIDTQMRLDIMDAFNSLESSWSIKPRCHKTQGTRWPISLEQLEAKSIEKQGTIHNMETRNLET